MSNLTTYGANALLNGTPLPALYAQLHTGNPTDAGTSNLAATSGREAITWNPATTGILTNDGLLGWVGGALENLSHLSLWDAASGGNCWAVGALGTPQGADVGIAVEIPDEALTLTLARWS